jgi:hypothetical protein
LANPTLADEYDHLAKKYNQDRKVFEEAIAKLITKNQALKENAKSWKAWGEKRKELYDHRGVKIRALHARIRELAGEATTRELTVEAEPPRPSTVRSSSVEGPPPLGRSPSAIAETNSEILSTVYLTEEDKLPPLPLDLYSPNKHTAAEANSRKQAAISTPEEVPTSSQTTDSYDTSENISSPHNKIREAPPQVNKDCEPIIVSEVTRKRKRGASNANSNRPPAGANAEGLPEGPIKIKEERYSSPIGSPTRRVLARTETLDLDDIGDRIDTPRKRRRMREILRQASSFETIVSYELKNDRSTSVPLEPHSPGCQLSDENLDPTCTPRLARGGSDPTHRSDEKALSEPSYSFSLKRELEEDATPSRSHVRPLGALSMYQRMLPRTSDPNAPKGRKRDPEREAKAIHALAEDGSHSSRPSRCISPKSRKRADRRLGALLEQPTPDKQPLLLEPRSTRSETKPAPQIKTPVAPRSRLSENTPALGVLPTPTSMPHAKATSGFMVAPSPQHSISKNIKKEKTTIHTTPRNVKPLRDRPVIALRLEDFRLNPKIYHGSELTAESIRGRDARRHQMGGCKDPKCATCGGQLKLLAANLPVTVGSTLFASTQDDLLTEDEKLIKYYLGDRFNQARVARMEAKERDALIMKAKELIISERHIRHRVKPNQRGKSPPGFWNVDMPDTQEIEAQREEADKREREVVEERYREAMRAGGKWVFKDE